MSCNEVNQNKIDATSSYEIDNQNDIAIANSSLDYPKMAGISHKNLQLLAAPIKENQATVGRATLQNLTTVCRIYLKALFYVLWRTVVTTVSAIYGAYKFNCSPIVIFFPAANSWPTGRPRSYLGPPPSRTTSEMPHLPPNLLGSVTM